MATGFLGTGALVQGQGIGDNKHSSKFLTALTILARSAYSVYQNTFGVQESLHEDPNFGRFFARETILPGTDHNCAIFGIYGRTDITREDVVNEMLQVLQEEGERAEVIRELMQAELEEYIQNERNEAFHEQNNRVNSLEDYLKFVLGQRIGNHEQDPYPLLQIANDGTGAVAAIAYMRGVHLRVWQRTVDNDLDLYVDVDLNDPNRTPVNLLHTTADASQTHANNHFNLLTFYPDQKTLDEAIKEGIENEDQAILQSILEQIPSLEQIPNYEERDVEAQLLAYQKIYDELRELEIINGVAANTLHSEGLYEILIEQAFPLTKKALIEDVKNAKRDNASIEIIKNLEKRITHLTKLFEETQQMYAERILTAFDFYKINAILVSLRISFDSYIEILSSLSNELHSHAYMDEVFKILPITSTIRQLTDVFLYSVYTSSGAAISEEQFVIYFKDNVCLTSIDISPKKSTCRRYDENGRYYPHNGRHNRSLLEHDAFHYSTTHMFNSSFKNWDENMIAPFRHILCNKNDYPQLTDNEFLILAKAAFFLLHEKEVWFSGLDPSSFGIYAAAGLARNCLESAKRYSFNNSHYGFTELFWILNVLKQTTDSLFNYIHEDKRTYNFVYRDFETMLRSDLFFDQNQQDVCKFTLNPFSDEKENPLIPSLEALLDKARQRYAIEIDPNLDKRTQWKALPQDIKKQLKEESLKFAFKSFWDLVLRILDKADSGLILRKKG